MQRKHLYDICDICELDTMVEFRLKLADNFHRKIKANAALEGITMQQFIVLALDSFIIKPKTTKIRKKRKIKRKR